MRHSVTQYRPNRSLFDMWEDFDNFFERALQIPNNVGTSVTAAKSENWFAPRVDVQEKSNAFMISVDLPGVKKDDIKVDLSGRTLTISGERKTETKSENEGRQYVERSFGSFSRSFTLPETAQLGDIEAKFENGVLELAIPKKATIADEKKSIPIETKKGGFFDRLVSKGDEKTQH